MAIAGILALWLGLMVPTASHAATATLVDFNATWKYLDDGSDQGTAWRDPGFDDSSWASGPAELGFGDGDEATVVDGGTGGNRHTTTYYRHAFNVADPSIYTALSLQAIRDDGIVVYLNGTEVFRDNMPDGTITVDTFALEAISGNQESLPVGTNLAPGVLNTGNNVFAVEIHQNDSNPPDSSFALELTGETPVGNLPPSVSITSPSNNDNFVAPASITIDATASDSDGTVTLVEFFVDGVKLGEDATDPYSVTWNSPAEGTYDLTAVATDNDAASTTSATVTISVSTSGPVTFIPFGADWKYLDDGSDQGTAWQALGYDDNAWASGPAELGYGDGDEATVVSFGSDPQNVHPTIYYRHVFDVPDPSLFNSLNLDLIRDDGAVVYLNGTELYRTDNMPGGPIAFDLYTGITSSDNQLDSVVVTAAPLVAGDNVLAVEVHQAGPTSSDSSFNLNLVGDTGVVVNDPPSVSITSPINNAVFSAPADISITASASDSDGSIAMVEFYEGSNLLGTDNTPPYNVTMSATPVGSYQLTAVATDNLGLSSTSAVVNVSVGVADAPTVESVSPSPGTVGSLTQITVTFSEPVEGVDAADLLVNGFAALSVSGADDTYTFIVPRMVEGPVFVSWSGVQDIIDFETPGQEFDPFGPGATWQYTIVDNVNPTVTRISPVDGATVTQFDEFKVWFSEPIAGINRTDLLINGSPASAVDGSDDGPYTFEFIQPANGNVTVNWAGGHGITDQSAAANAFAGGSYTFNLDTNLVFEGQVVINEIMYHPASERVEDEYIELYNTGASAVNLTGWELNRGVDFVFPNVSIPAGGYLVVAADLPTFNAKYPGVANVVGGWTGRLSNSRDDVELEDAQGDRVDLVVYADEGDFAVRTDIGGGNLDWLSDADGLGNRSLELRNPALPNNNGQNWLPSTIPDGTPGVANTVAETDIPPLIREVTHFPAVPRSTQPVTITARITDEMTNNIAVRLFYRDASTTSPPSFSVVPMADNGLNNDGIANDGIYGIVLNQMNNGTIIEFYVEAEDEGANVRTWPAPVEDGGPAQVANAFYQVNDEIYTGTQPVYHLIMLPADRNVLIDQRDRNARNVTLVSVDGDDIEIRYRCGVRRRGASSFNASPPTMKFNIPSDTPWKGKTSMNLNSVNTHSQVLGAAVALKAGLPTGYTRAVQVRFNGVNEAPSGNDMYGSYAHVEVANGEWARDHFPEDPNGNVYSKRRPECGLNYQGTDPAAYINCAYDKESNASENDWTDLMNLTFALDPSTTPDGDYVRAIERNLNVGLWMRYFAVFVLLDNNETMLAWGADDDYNMYRGIEDPRFIVLGHDYDALYGTAGASPNDIFIADNIPNISRFLHHPVFEPMFFEEYRHQLNNAFSTNNLFPLFDQVLGDWVPSGVLNNLKAEALDRINFVAGQLPAAPTVAKATIRGEPDSPAYIDSATLIVGGDNISSYRYRVNGGSYGAETPVGTPISLSNLSDGAYTVFVIGRHTNGDWQDSDEATVSKTWIVIDGFKPVVINEVLAVNDTAFDHFGTFPDMIELFNPGNTTVDLVGMRLTDNLDNPDKFIFPATTTIGSGSYLRLFANNPDGTSGIHLGFSLNQNGETLYLVDTAANGGRVIDKIKFGLQLADRSIGRLSNGQWGLTTPTLGAVNVAEPTGDPALLKVNEWLASGAAPFFDDFVELYNPGSLPVDIGNFFMTDNPIGYPFNHRITPLSFIDAFVYQAFIADGNKSAGADHVDFQLSAEYGEVALLDPDGMIIDCVIYGLQQPGISMGRSPNGSPLIVFLNPPTPGAGNPVVTPPPPPLTANLIAWDDIWTFDESGNDLGTGWRAVGFDDSGWPSGPGLLGEESSALPQPIQTPVTAPASGGPTTTYYRTHFAYDADTDIGGLQLTHIIDDGAIFYINDNEVARFNMPGGAVDFQTLTPTSTGNATVNGPIMISFADLVDGDNVMAVEVHQSSLGSSDVVMGVQLDVIIITNTPSAAGVVINEVLADNVSFTEADGSTPDWVELYNPSGQPVDLEGMSLADLDGNSWVFPNNSIVPANGYLRIFFDGDAPVSSNNTGFGLNDNGDTVSLFDNAAPVGALLDSISFGVQAADWSIGRFPDGSATITLLLPSALGVNLEATLGDRNLLKINEWMADPFSGDDWFEIYNPNAQPVALGGLHLTDDLTDRLKSPIPPLSYIGTGTRGYVDFKADNNLDAGADHVAFRLGAGGDSLGISDEAGTLIHDISFGPQLEGVSEGSLPDGDPNIVSFATTASPGSSNFLPIDDVAINEILTHSDDPLEDAIELVNLTGAPVDVSYWWLSDARRTPKKFQIPNGTVIPANGFVVFYEFEFNPNPGGPLSFSLSSARGDNLFLSEGLANGTLTGFKEVVDFGPAANGVSFGRHPTSVGVDFTAMAARTFGLDNPDTIQQFRTGNGLANSAPLVGPIVINEVMYHPPDLPGAVDNTLDEYVELLNVTGSAVALFDVNFPTNTWRLRKAVDFDFPQSVTIGPGEHILVVSFDPVADPVALSDFRTTYGLDPSVPIYGPYQGKLDNSSESVRLYKPDPPETAPSPDEGLVPYVLADKVDYTDLAPWPTTPDGLGDSLQRVNSSLYGNDPVNWNAAAPTPGASNSGPSGNTPPVLGLIGNKVVLEGNTVAFTATGSDVDTPAQSLTFSIDPGAPAAASINPTSGAFSWTTSEPDGPGVFSVTIRVTDDGSPNLSDTETITITVNEDNQAPILANITNKTVDEGTPLNFTASATDGDLPVQVLTFSLDAGAPNGASIDPVSGEFSWIPSEAQGPGVYPITIRVADNAGSPLDDSDTINVTVNEINAAPTTTPIAQQSVEEGNQLQVTVPANDSDLPAQTLSFSLDVGAPAGSSVNPSTGIFSWTPNDAQSPSTNTIGVRITDDGSPALSVTNNFIVVVSDFNQPPTLDPISDATIDELTELTFTASGNDTDVPAQALTYSLDPGAPSGATIDGSSGVFSWTPAEDQGPSSPSITVRVTDDGTPNKSATRTFTVTVDEVNQAPSMDAITDKSITAGSTLAFTATATDDDEPAQNLTFSLDPGAPAGASIDASGNFTWTPTGAQSPSVNSITVRVADDGSPLLEDTTTFEVTVSDQPILVDLVELTQVWKYNDSGQDLGATWREVAYDDSGWTEGAAALYNEDSPLPVPKNTLLSLTDGNGERFITYYFRTRFFLPSDPSGVTIWTSNYVDDGAVFYINGVEAGRINMPTGTIDAFTTALGSHEGNTNDLQMLDPSGLVAGDNVFAVEVHQRDPNSSDVVFASAMAAIIPPPTPVAIISQPADQTVDVGMPASFSVTASGTVPQYQWFKDGAAIPGATSSTYDIASAQLADAGDYHVEVSNLANSVTSSTAVLTVNPSAVPPVFTGISESGGVVTVMWDSLPGRSYQLQYKNDLSDPTWTDIGGPVVATGPSTTAVDLIDANTQRFYQVILLD